MRLIQVVLITLLAAVAFVACQKEDCLQKDLVNDSERRYVKLYTNEAFNADDEFVLALNITKQIDGRETALDIRNNLNKTTRSLLITSKDLENRTKDNPIILSSDYKHVVYNMCLTTQSYNGSHNSLFHMEYINPKNGELVISNFSFGAYTLSSSMALEQ